MIYCCGCFVFVTDTKLKSITYLLTMGQTQGTPLAISIAEQDVEKYLKQRQQEIGMYQG